MPKVSVIVPVYKVEPYLDRCLQSLTAQTLTDLEIILVDDGSPDRCGAICDDWALKDNRIRVIHKENQGLGFARNSGLEVATGEYIGFVDSDDYVATDMYEVMVNAAVANDAQLVMTGFCCVGGIMVADEKDMTLINCFDENTLFDGKESVDNLMLNICGAPPCKSQDSKYGFSSVKNLFSRRVIDEFGLRFRSEREVMSEDVFFVLEYLNHISRAFGVKGAHYYYCRNGESLSKSYRADRFEKSCFIIDEMNAQLARRMPENVFKIYTDRLLQAYARVDCMQEILFASSNNLSPVELNRRLSTIVDNAKLKAVLATYPIWRLPVAQAIFAFTMKHRLFWMMKLLVKIKRG